jgi:hypothetical protein
MLIQIETAPIGPLTVLPELPDARLAMIEGLNGVGKSLAVRLLQACTGESPYPRSSASWTSLCDGLGPFTISVSKLNDADSIRWVGDTRDWLTLGPDDPPTFHELSIDGAPADLRAVQRLLAVHRIAGDEGIVETLANQAIDEADRIGRWARAVAGPTSGPLVDLEEAAQSAIDAVGDWTTDGYAQLERELAEAQRAIVDGSERAEALRAHRDALLEAKDLGDRLTNVRQRAPGLEARLSELDRELADAQRASAAAADEALRLAGTLAGASQLTKELKLARNNLERHQRNLSGETQRLSVAAAALGIPPLLANATDRRAELEGRLAELIAEQEALDTAPVMRGILDTLVGHLDLAEQRGLAEQVAIEDAEIGLELTVHQTRAGMASRRGILEGQPPPPETERLDREIQQARREVAFVEDLIGVFDSVERFRRLANQAEERLGRALASTDRRAAARFQRLEESRRENDEVVLSLAAERAVLAQQLGGDATGSEEALSGQFEAQLRSLDLPDGSRLVELIGQAQQETALAEQGVVSARELATRLRRDIARADADVQRSLETLRTGPGLAWFRNANPIIADPTSTSHQALGTLDQLRAQAIRVQDRLAQHRAQLGAVAQALRGIASQLRGEPLRADAYVNELQVWFGAQYSEWFSNPTIRRELLPNATGDIVVDLPTGQVQWNEPSGGRSRPLEAFSSGEQAFAYTRARLGGLDEQANRPANRLLVLDEFGAFIAHDRFGALLSYLLERAQHHPEDQVLVILPLSSDFAQLAEASFGDEARRLAALAEQVRTKRYVVQVLAP